MSKYKLSTGLWTVKETPEFNSDEEAWEYLRLILPNKFATLYKEVEVKLPYNNEEEYIKIHNAKYGPKPIGMGPDYAELLVPGGRTSKVWMPVLEGLTNDKYNVK